MLRMILSALVFSAVMWSMGCDSSPAVPDADPGPDSTGETFSVKIGPIAVPAGHEDTMCVEKRLGNLGHRWIGKLHTHLHGVSHHVIVYRVSSTEERPEPFSCVPFVDTLDPRKGTPLMVSQVHDETLDLPYGVAFGIEANQMVRVEMHFVNAGDADDTVDAEAVFDVLPEAQFRAEAGFLFIGDPDVELPPGQESTLGPLFFPMPPELSDVNVFALTGHEHRWGTNVQVEYVAKDGEPGMPIYDYPDWSWAEPPVAQYKPALTMTRGSGFNFTCKWNNRSSETVRFGESASDEMCFFWAYYYPSQGHKVCAHTERFGRPLDLCCPSPDPLCDELLRQFGGQ
jgi:Copper type II ascorbate-dependent monooxygenase, C-terminal domain